MKVFQVIGTGSVGHERVKFIGIVFAIDEDTALDIAKASNDSMIWRASELNPQVQFHGLSLIVGD